MKPALLLVDLQGDYLAATGLTPATGTVIAGAARLLELCRARSLPIVHVWTSVQRTPDQRMEHWKRAGTWLCEVGTDGHQPPPTLRPQPGEPIVHKTHFSAFEAAELEPLLRARGVDTVWLAGIHEHACLRCTALEAYQRGFQVRIVADAVGSHDPLHARLTRRYLDARGLSAQSTTALLEAARDDAGPTRLLSSGGKERFTEITTAIATTRRGAACWRRISPAQRAEVLERLAVQVGQTPEMAERITRDTGKPIRYAREEVAAAERQLRSLAARARELSAPQGTTPDGVRHQPHGVVGVITPWNNPLYLPVGKVGAALAYGNAVVWKPAPVGLGVARCWWDQVRRIPQLQDVVAMIPGGSEVGEALLEIPGIDALTLTGSAAAGWSATVACARRHLPLQAELGGNNAAIVWEDADLATAAVEIAEGAFAMAGQRCTANRRVIVSANVLGEFRQHLLAAIAQLRWGDPLDPATQVGPLVSASERDRIAALLDRAATAGCALTAPHTAKSRGPEGDAYFPPTLVEDAHPGYEIVQEESFGPVLVLQVARDWDDALVLHNGVRQGLVGALFARSTTLQERFLDEAQAGILKLNRSTAGADVDRPFGGWKASGIGPAEHGASDREFFTRVQTVYR